MTSEKSTFRIVALYQSITVFESVLALVLASALGVAFWGWTFVYEFLSPFLKLSGLGYLSAGFWILTGVLIPNIIRKPLLGIAASVMAAFVQSMLTHWGLMSLVWGLVQGLGAELIFFLFMYRRWNLAVLILAALSSTVFSYLLDYFYYNYANLSLQFNFIQLGGYLVSSLFLAGVLSYFLSKRLVKLGVLDQFLIAKDYEL